MMNDATQDPTRCLRRQVYWLLIAVAAAIAIGHVLSTERVYEPSLAPPPGVAPDGRNQAWPPNGRRGRCRRSAPTTARAGTLSGPWWTMGTFVIGRRDRARITPDQPYGDYGIAFEDGWFTVDKVLNPETHEYYSSKPPLLTVVMAGEYWLIKHTLGWSINEHPDAIVRIGLLTFNVLPLILYLWMMGRLAERYGATDWGRLFVVAAAAFGTLLSAFLITFSNHVPAAFATLIALYAALPVAFPTADSGGLRPRLAKGAGRFVVAGLAAGFLFNCEMPAAAFIAALGLLLLVRAPDGRCSGSFRRCCSLSRPSSF